MKIVKQEKLFYIQASSHKVYEVDLCEVGHDEYIVNVRYGEKGGVMREGTKTVFPVSYDKALNTFQDLVNAKMRKNYQSENTPNPTISFENTSTSTQEEKPKNVFSSVFSSLTASNSTPQNQGSTFSFKTDSKKESILLRLEEAVKGNHIDKKWKLSRVIWKAGELKITEAVPFIVQLAKTKKDPLYQYCVAWSLGRLKQGGDSIAVLMDYYQNGDDKVKRMAGEALLENLPTEEVKNALDSILVSLPQVLIDVIKTEKNAEILKVIKQLIKQEYKDKVPDFLYTLYLVSKTQVAVRWALLSFLKKIKIKRNLFKPIRHIFKMAEFREDSQVFGLIAAQIYRQESKFHSTQYNRREIQYSAAFSQYTKEYFHRRILRTLTSVAENEPAHYVEMASEILLAYNQAKEFPKNQIALHYILHGGSDNWILERNISEYYWYDTTPQHNLAFTLRQDRLESHQEIWDNNQVDIERLLKESNTEPVLAFASKVFFTNQTWIENIKIPFVVNLLAKDSLATRLLGIDIAKKIYDPSQPQIDLINALLQTPYAPAQELAFEWIQANPTKFLAEWEILHFLLIATSTKIQEWVVQNIPLYSKLIPQESLEKALAKTLFLICDLQALEKIVKQHWNNATDKIINEQYLTPIVDNLWHCFSEKLIGLSVEVIVNLLNNPLERIQYLGARIVINHKTLSKNLPNELLISLLTSKFPSVRREGTALISKFDVSTLLKYQIVLWNQTFDGTDDVKTYLQGIHKYIASEDSTYLQKFAHFLLKEAPFTKDVNFYFEDITIQAELIKIDLTNFERWVMCDIENIQILIFDILLKHQNVPQQLPKTYLDKALTSTYASVRNKGLQLLSSLPLEDLLKQKEVIISLCSANEPSIQEGITHVLQKMLQNEEFVIYAINELSQNLLRKETYEGLHEHILQLIQQNFSNHLNHLSDKRMWKLVHTNHKAGNQLGAILLKKQDLSKTTIKTLVNLGSHEAVLIRQIVWEYFEKDVPRIRYEAEQALRLLSASWDDSKEFAFQYFEKHFEKEHWTPELLISICDNVQADIQQYGRKLITRFFEEESGEMYLLHLSQHPSKEVQLMVTNYVERFASEHLENIEKLLPYFATVLMGINKGRVAKQRIFEFLHKQSLEKEAVSKMILPTLIELSLTVSIENKAKIIQILRDIQVKFPHLENPIKVKEVITI